MAPTGFTNIIRPVPALDSSVGPRLETTTPAVTQCRITRPAHHRNYEILSEYCRYLIRISELQNEFLAVTGGSLVTQHLPIFGFD